MTYFKYFVALFLISLPSITSRSIPSKETKDAVQYFINGKVLPEHYNVRLMTHVEDCEKTCGFEGKINITVSVNGELVGKNEKIREIQLNSVWDIKIKACILIDAKGSEIPVKYSLNNETEILTVTITNSQELCHDQKYNLYFEYSSIHNDNMLGFYRSSYMTPNGIRRWLLTTQFQANDARAAFPCFDEPKYKATFDMAITISKKAVQEKYQALFNTDIAKIVENENGITYVFNKTPYRLSTYLIAFTVSDFSVTKPLSFVSDYGSEKNRKKSFETWGEKKYIENGDAEFPQIVGASAIKILTEYLGVGFAYPKIDQVGIPDFAAGAMENWGLVTYRERILFYNNRTGSEYTKKDVVNVITHELTHQWFGNLVTLLSWDYIWLNEGFATYFSYFTSEKVAEEVLNSNSWNTLGQMVIDETQTRAMETDGLENSRPLSIQVKNPNIVGSYFDSISYSKGASVLRMWSHALSDPIFRKGLNLYLNQRREKNSVPSELIKSFEKACDESNCIDAKIGKVSELFEEWHSTGGYPVITVEKTSKSSYRLSQEQFLWYHNPNTTIHSNKWSVPISYSVASNPQFENTKPKLWLKKTESAKEFAVDKEEKWIIVNNQATGYFRVNYDNQNWAAIISQLKENHCKIHEINRAQLINDAFSFARSTFKDYKVGYDTALDLLGYLYKEENTIPWQSAIHSISFLNNKLSAGSSYQSYKQFILRLLKPRYDSLGLIVRPNDSHLEKLLRMDISEWACSLGYKDCIEDALKLYKNPAALSPDVMKTVYCTAIREGGDKVWDAVWDLYRKTLNNVEQTTYLSALGCSNSPKKLSEYLDKTITKNSGIRKQDYGATFSSVYKAGNTQAALRFLIEKFEAIANSYTGLDPLGTLLIGISSRLNTEEDLKAMKNLKSKIENSEIEVVRTAKVSIGKAIEIIESNIKWINLKEKSIQNWLESNKFTV